MSLLRANGSTPDRRVREAIAVRGLVTVAKQVDSDPRSWWQFVDIAIEHGHLDLVQWIVEGVEASDGLGELARPDASSGGTLELIEWLVDRGWPLGTQDPTLVATSRGNLPCLIWLTKRGYEPCSDTLVAAAQHGHCHMVDWLLQEGVELTTAALQWAAYEATREVVAFLLDRGAPLPDPLTDLTRWSCANAHGNDLFVWLVDVQRMPWVPTQCTEEARDQPAFDAMVLCDRSDVDLHPLYVTHAVARSDIDRLRAALDRGVELDEADLVMILDGQETAMLVEVLEHWGSLDGEYREVMDGAVGQLFSVHDDLVQILAQWGYTVVLTAKSDASEQDCSGDEW
jgi:hypothetical protein